MVSVFVQSCKHNDSSDLADNIEFVSNEENGLSKTKIINGVKVNLTYRPTDLLVAQEISNLDKQHNYNKDSIKNKYNKNLYFILSLSKDDKEILSTISSSRQHFNEIQSILSFGMHNVVSLTNQKKDTIQLIDYNFPRTYGMARATSLLFIFKRDEAFDKSDDIIFNIKDFGIGIGDVKFKYPTNIVNN